MLKRGIISTIRLMPLYSLLLSRLHQTGFEAGVKHGRDEGRVDGFSTGQVKGMEVGDEV